MKKNIPRIFKWVFSSVLAIGLILVIVLLVTKQFTVANENDLPTFIKANAIDPKLVTSVSKFRSGMGHSNPGWPETCRSMKHYVNTNDPAKKLKERITMEDRKITPPAEYAIDLYSPVDGRLTKSDTGEGDDQLNISVDGERGFSIRFEHVHLNSDIGSFAAKVKAGQKIATIWNGQNFDLSVFYHYFRGDQLVSYFQVLPDNLFIAWLAQGATNPNEFMITREYRDAHPLKCLNDRRGTPSFAGPDGEPTEFSPDGEQTESWTKENLVQLAGYRTWLEKIRQLELDTVDDFYSCAKYYPVLETTPATCKTKDDKVLTKEK